MFPDVVSLRPRRCGRGRARAAGCLTHASALATTHGPRLRVPPNDKCLDGLTGKYKQEIDMPNPTAALCLVHIRNYLKAWKDNYNLEHPQINAVGTLYFKT